MDQTDLLRHVVEAMEALDIAYMIVGSQASIYYGEPPFTQDIDVVADKEAGHVPGLLGRFPAGEFYVSPGMLRIPGTAIDRGYVTEWAARLGLAAIWESPQAQVPRSSDA